MTLIEMLARAAKLYDTPVFTSYFNTFHCLANKNISPSLSQVYILNGDTDNIDLH